MTFILITTPTSITLTGPSVTTNQPITSVTCEVTSVIINMSLIFIWWTIDHSITKIIQVWTIKFYSNRKGLEIKRLWRQGIHHIMWSLHTLKIWMNNIATYIQIFEVRGFTDVRNPVILLLRIICLSKILQILCTFFTMHCCTCNIAKGNTQLLSSRIWLKSSSRYIKDSFHC